MAFTYGYYSGWRETPRWAAPSASEREKGKMIDQREQAIKEIFGVDAKIGQDTESFRPEPYMPCILGSDWRILLRAEDGVAYLRRDGLKVLATCSMELDGKLWLHVSCSRKNRLPDWKDLQDTKDQFIGCDKTALSVLPPEDKYVNLNPVVLHLWHCVDGDVTPDFTRGGDSR